MGAERIVEMHRAAARHQKALVDTGLDETVGDEIGDADGRGQGSGGSDVDVGLRFAEAGRVRLKHVHPPDGEANASFRDDLKSRLTKTCARGSRTRAKGESGFRNQAPAGVKELCRRRRAGPARSNRRSGGRWSGVCGERHQQPDRNKKDQPARALGLPCGRAPMATPPDSTPAVQRTTGRTIAATPRRPGSPAWPAAAAGAAAAGAWRGVGARARPGCGRIWRDVRRVYGAPRPDEDKCENEAGGEDRPAAHAVQMVAPRSCGFELHR